MININSYKENAQLALSRLGILLPNVEFQKDEQVIVPTFKGYLTSVSDGSYAYAIKVDKAQSAKIIGFNPFNKKYALLTNQSSKNKQPEVRFVDKGLITKLN